MHSLLPAALQHSPVPLVAAAGATGESKQECCSAEQGLSALWYHAQLRAQSCSLHSHSCSEETFSQNEDTDITQAVAIFADGMQLLSK